MFWSIGNFISSTSISHMSVMLTFLWWPLWRFKLGHGHLVGMMLLKLYRDIFNIIISHEPGVDLVLTHVTFQIRSKSTYNASMITLLPCHMINVNTLLWLCPVSKRMFSISKSQMGSILIFMWPFQPLILAPGHTTLSKKIRIIVSEMLGSYQNTTEVFYPCIFYMSLISTFLWPLCDFSN